MLRELLLHLCGNLCGNRLFVRTLSPEKVSATQDYLLATTFPGLTLDLGAGIEMGARWGKRMVSRQLAGCTCFPMRVCEACTSFAHSERLVYSFGSRRVAGRLSPGPALLLAAAGAGPRPAVGNSAEVPSPMPGVSADAATA